MLTATSSIHNDTPKYRNRNTPVAHETWWKYNILYIPYIKIKNGGTVRTDTSGRGPPSFLF